MLLEGKGVVLPGAASRRGLGPPPHLYRHYGLDGEGAAAAVRTALAKA